MTKEIDPIYEHLLNTVHGLQGVVISLSELLISKGITDKETLVLNLDVYSDLLAQNPDQAEVFQSVKRTLAGEGVWIPRVLEGGKSNSPQPEDGSDDE